MDRHSKRYTVRRNPFIDSPERCLTIKESLRHLFYCTLHAAYTTLFLFLAWLFIKDYDRFYWPGFKEAATPLFLGVIGLIFLIFFLLHLADWIDGGVYDIEGVLVSKNFGGIIDSLSREFMLMNDDGETITLAVGFREFFRYKKGERLHIGLTRKMKTVVSIERL